MTTNTDKLTTDLKRLEKDIARLLKSIKRDISDDYRCTDDPDDDKPGMVVTIGFTFSPDGDSTWNYQTGDNSYAGGAYGHPDWAIIYLYKRSNCASLAQEACDDLAGLILQ